MKALNRRDALRLGLATAGAAITAGGALASATPKVGDLCSIEYPVTQGNGPWNYMYEGQPEGVTHARHIGYWVGEDERHYLTAHEFAKFSDGRIEPIHMQHWSKDGRAVISVIKPKDWQQ